MIPKATDLIIKYMDKNPYKTIEEIMIEFAKLHVTEALKQASEKVTMKIKEAYSLDEIK